MAIIEPWTAGYTLLAGPVTTWAVDRIGVNFARSMRFTWKVADPATCDFEIDAHRPEVERLSPIINDVALIAEGVTDPLFRGRIVSMRERLDHTDHVLSLQAIDYAGVLDARAMFEGDTLSYSAVEQTDIAWALIQTTQARSGGNLGIVEGSNPASGVLATVSYEPGSYIRENIDMIAEADDGFDWEVDGALRFNTWSPYRIRDTGLTLDYGGMVTDSEREFTSSAYGNVVRGSGGSDETVTTTPVSLAVIDIATRPEGRWERQFSWPDVVNQGVLAAKTAYQTARMASRLGTLTLTMRSGHWRGPFQLWIGDLVTLDIPLMTWWQRPAGTLPVGQVRELTLELDEDGGETVKLLIQETGFA